MRPQDVNNKRILFLVLDWGLGHASRSLPLINQLLKQNNKLTLASSGSALLFLKQAFPELEIYETYQKEVVYSKFMPVWIKLLGQVFKIKKLVTTQRIEEVYDRSSSELLISDNVYIQSKKMCQHALITHQLSVPTPFGFFIPLPKKWLDTWKHVWIPDDEKIHLSGKLSQHPKIKGVFIGFLSQWKAPFNSDHLKQFKYSKGMIASGPIAHRLDMESKVDRYGVNWVANTSTNMEVNGVKYFQVLASDELNELVNQTAEIVLRGGYSTLMDLKSVDYQGKLTFYPHQGQLEQKYLQKRWKQLVEVS